MRLRKGDGHGYDGHGDRRRLLSRSCARPATWSRRSASTQKTIKALTSFAEARGGVYTPALGAAFASMTISPRTGRFSAQRRFDYRRLVGVFDSLRADRPGGSVVPQRGGGGPRPGSGEFTALAPRGRPTWPTVAWRRPPATPTAGWPAATWCSWSHAGSPASRCRRRQRAGVPGIAVGPVGDVVVVLGGVELPPVLEVHRPHRPGRRGRPGRCQAFPPDLPVLGDDDQRLSSRRARRGGRARGTRRSPCWR